MRFHTLAPVAVLLLVVFSGCIKEEPLNAECDIVEASIPGNVLNRPAQITNTEVTFYLKPGVHATALAPEFTLTEGATIAPPSGTVRDFTTPQHYTVTSQSGEWTKTYTVRVDDGANLALEYDFTRATTESKYYEFYIGDTDQKWASANPAFLLTGQGKTPDDYPTYQVSTPEHGKCVALTTRSTGPFGAAMKKPIAAGNIFLGKFDSASALKDALGATQFGRPFYEIPLYLNGLYKYTSGPVYCEPDASGKLVEVPGRQDECNVYAVLFEVTPEMPWLDGRNVMSADNPNIVAVARFSDAQRRTTDGWQEFSLPFEYRRELDPAKLAAGDYSITIVGSSSMDGDFFAGAVGSTLVINNFTITCYSEN